MAQFLTNQLPVQFSPAQQVLLQQLQDVLDKLNLEGPTTFVISVDTDKKGKSFFGPDNQGNADDDTYYDLEDSFVCTTSSDGPSELDNIIESLSSSSSFSSEDDCGDMSEDDYQTYLEMEAEFASSSVDHDDTGFGFTHATDNLDHSAAVGLLISSVLDAGADADVDTGSEDETDSSESEQETESLVPSGSRVDYELDNNKTTAADTSDVADAGADAGAGADADADYGESIVLFILLVLMFSISTGHAVPVLMELFSSPSTLCQKPLEVIIGLVSPRVTYDVFYILFVEGYSLRPILKSIYERTNEFMKTLERE